MYSLTFQYFRAILCDRRSASDFNSVISDPEDIMVRGNEESFIEHGFGVAGLNGCRKVACDKF